MEEHIAIFIADLLRQGFTAGVGPRWSISFDCDHYAPAGIKRIDEIARLVERGSTSGADWTLRVGRLWSDSAAERSSRSLSKESNLADDYKRDEIAQDDAVMIICAAMLTMTTLLWAAVWLIIWYSGGNIRLPAPVWWISIAGFVLIGTYGALRAFRTNCH